MIRKNILKKGAMFGLDARIALAIFGALSVISGAALYSAIQQAKTEQWRQYFEEIIKASEQYYLDNGTPLALDSSWDQIFIGDLIENGESLTTWKGPYWNADNIYFRLWFDESTTKKIHSSSYIRSFLRKTSTWSEMDDLNTDGICASYSPDCSEWHTLYAGDPSASNSLLKLFNDLDELIDNGDGQLQGKVRFNTFAHDYIMYQGIPRRKT